MNALLINPWITDFAAYDFWNRPLGLLYVGAFLHQRGHSVRIVDCMDRFQDGVDKAPSSELVDGIRKGPHPGKDHFFGPGDRSRIGGDFSRLSDAFKPFLHAPEVAHLIVDDSNHGPIIGGGRGI